MGKITGFMEYDRKGNISISPKERIKNFDEFHDVLNEKDRREQGARCMNCGVPFCGSSIKLNGMVTGCPLHNLIPEWNDEIYNGNYTQGLSRLIKTSSFPEFTGRVCPALCEKACINGLDSSSVTIRDNELFLIETGFASGDIKPMIPQVRTDKRVAVIGSGPAGLAVADKLNKRGHNVTVYERDDRIGGLLMYGIPNMKLEKEIVQRRVDLMTAEGVKFEINADFGKTLKAKQVVDEHDAVVMCIGAKKPRDLQLENREVEGIYFAVDFLTSTIKGVIDGGLKEGNHISSKGKKVIVVGGGDTGNDCVGTCLRHGATSVVQLEMMPKAPDVRADDNPWPEWPKVCNVDYGQQEHIELYGHDPRVYSTTIKEVCQKDGKLTGVKTVEVEFVDGKLTHKEGSEKELEADMILISAGFLGTESYSVSELGLELDARSNIVTSENGYKTDVEKVFAAGDTRRGQSLVVWAIAEGRACAKEVDEYLMGYTSM